MNRYALISAAALVLAGAGAATAQSVGIATSNTGSLYYSSGSAIAKVANEKAGLGATVHPFASPTVYLPAVDAGEYTFGISNVEELRVAVVGESQFEGRPLKNLRAVVILYPLRVALFVRKDSDIHSIADLRGKRVTDGYTSQKTIPPLLDAEFATAGMTRKDIKSVQVPNVVGGANAFISGKADAFFFALGSAKVREADASVGGLRALDIADTPENRAIAKKYFPPAYLRAEKPSKPNIGVEAPIHVITYDAALSTNASTPDDVVYRMAKAMHENKKELAASFGVFNLFDPNRMATDLGPIQWHPGTIKFLEEKGMWPPK